MRYYSGLSCSTRSGLDYNISRILWLCVVVSSSSEGPQDRSSYPNRVARQTVLWDRSRRLWADVTSSKQAPVKCPDGRNCDLSARFAIRITESVSKILNMSAEQTLQSQTKSGNSIYPGTRTRIIIPLLLVNGSPRTTREDHTINTKSRRLRRQGCARHISEIPHVQRAHATEGVHLSFFCLKVFALGSLHLTPPSTDFEPETKL